MGGDDSDKPGKVDIMGFNPRPRMGGDVEQAEREYMSALVSIHAPAWGATKESRFYCVGS